MLDAFVEDLPCPGAVIRAEFDNAAGVKPGLLISSREVAPIHPVEDLAEFGPPARPAVLVYQPVDLALRLSAHRAATLPSPGSGGKIPQARLVGDEAVADPRYGVDVMRLLGVALDLLAQPVDVGVNGARLDLDLVAPHLAEQLATAHHLPGLRGQ